MPPPIVRGAVQLLSTPAIGKNSPSIMCHEQLELEECIRTRPTSVLPPCECICHRGLPLFLPLPSCKPRRRRTASTRSQLCEACIALTRRACDFYFYLSWSAVPPALHTGNGTHLFTSVGSWAYLQRLTKPIFVHTAFHTATFPKYAFNFLYALVSGYHENIEAGTLMH